MFLRIKAIRIEWRKKKTNMSNLANNNGSRQAMQVNEPVRKVEQRERS